MIISTAPGHILDKLRRIAGPNPEGSRLTDTERLHLIWMLTSMVNAMREDAFVGYGAVRAVKEQLNACGMPDEVISELCHTVPRADPIPMANAIAVHPSLRSADYLD